MGNKEKRTLVFNTGWIMLPFDMERRLGIKKKKMFKQHQNVDSLTVLGVDWAQMDSSHSGSLL